MRFFLTLLLAIAIPFNAAFAAAAALCDTEESHATHGWHMGHHDHDHGSPDNSQDTQSAGDGHHTHAHPAFSSVLPASLEHKALTGNDVRHAEPIGGLASAPPSRLERPPRNNLVA